MAEQGIYILFFLLSVFLSVPFFFLGGGGGGGASFFFFLVFFFFLTPGRGSFSFCNGLSCEVSLGAVCLAVWTNSICKACSR